MLNKYGRFDYCLYCCLSAAVWVVSPVAEEADGEDEHVIGYSEQCDTDIRGGETAYLPVHEYYYGVTDQAEHGYKQRQGKVKQLSLHKRILLQRAAIENTLSAVN